MAKYHQGELNRNDFFQKLNSAIHDFAKRQETWFRRMERNGTIINWVDGAADPLAQAFTILEANGILPRRHGGIEKTTELNVPE